MQEAAKMAAEMAAKMAAKMADFLQKRLFSWQRFLTKT